jgi:nuclear transport factor 2 (NTF2) superfamily protein
VTALPSLPGGGRSWSSWPPSGRELEYRLIKELCAFGGNRIAVRFVSEYRTSGGPWFRSSGTESWEFAADGLVAVRNTAGCRAAALISASGSRTAPYETALIVNRA